jgi:maltose/moltooligosaccharide transporter
MQSFFIGVGASFANALPFLFRAMGVTGTTASGIPLTVKYSFQVGAVVFLLCVLWTVFTTTEIPPDDMAEFERARRERRGVPALFGEIGSAIREMPRTMKQLAVVQFFTWLGLFCMWMFFGITVARHVFGATDPQSELYARGTEWGGLMFSVYSIVCFAVAFALPRLAAATSRKMTHAVALACGALGLLSVSLIHDRYLLILTMVGVGIAWASILSMPFAILSGALPAHRMGVYMGVFNFFIVIPEILAALAFGRIIRAFFGADNPSAPLYMVMIGGVSMLVAAALVMIVDDVGEASAEAVIGGDAHEPLTVQGSVQPVPSTGLVDDPARRS